MYRFTCIKHKHKNNKTCEKCDPMKLKLSCIQKTQQRKAWPQRGRESTLTAFHSCHRPRIPFGHVLIERRCTIKHCKRGCNKEKERPTHHKQQKRVPFQTHRINNNITCENVDPMKLELSHIQNTQQRKAWPQMGERKSTYCVTYLSPHPYSILKRLN